MQIRRAVAEEAEELSKLALDAKAHWGYERGQLRAWHSSLEISGESVSARPTFVAELDGQVVGFYSLVPSPNAWELDNLWVTPQFIKQGIGRVLLVHAAQTAAERGAPCIVVDADPNAETFYLRCGARRVGAVAAPIAGDSNRVRPQLVLSVMRSKTSVETALIDPLPRIGPRIVLRRLRPADLANFQAYQSDPEVGRYQSWSPMSTGDAAAFLTEMSTATFGTTGQWFQLGIAERSTERLIGDIGVCVRDSEDQHAELGFTLAADSQGQGLGSEAVRLALAMLFESSDILRVVAITDTRNHATVRLLQRVGMKLTGTLDSGVQHEGRLEHVFEVCRHEQLSRTQPSS